MTTDKGIEAAARAILDKVPDGYGMTEAEADGYARAAIAAYFAALWQTRTRIDEPSARWSEWRDGRENFSDKYREYIEVEYRPLFATKIGGSHDA